MRGPALSALQPRIVVQGVGKCYVKYDDTPLLFTSALRWHTKTARSRLWALRDIDLAVAPGECVGVIGHNGSGKSTLMRLLAGVTAPTVGRVAVRGRIAPLISVGVGFHQELTGRENVFLNGIILGLTRQELDRRFDDIVDFAEIGPFIDTPVKFYSTGMFMRLGFAVSVLADPRVLLVDEVLSVGDLGFQIKCFDRMQQIKAAGTTLVLVSHNMSAVRRLCDRTIVLDHGRIRHDGDTGDAISLFNELLDLPADPSRSTTGLDTRQSANGNAGLVTVTSFEVVQGGAPVRRTRSGDEISLEAVVRLREAVDGILVGLVVKDGFGHVACAERMPFDLAGSQVEDHVDVSVVVLPTLGSGSYSFQLAFADLAGTKVATSRAIEVFVDGRELVDGIADLGARFSVGARTGRWDSPR